MKGKTLKLASLIAAVSLVIGMFASSAYAQDGAESTDSAATPQNEGVAVPAESGDLVWDFEDGKLEPFTIASGEFGTIISAIPKQHNAPTVDYPRQGAYHLSTLESTTFYTETSGAQYGEFATQMTQPTDAYVGEIHSPIFRLDDPKIDFLIGGGNNNDVYVALCNIYGQEIIKARNAISGEDMIRIQWDATRYKLVGEPVFIKIVDKTNGAWGHLTFDDFHAIGEVLPNAEILPPPAPELHWSFEDGMLYPFTTQDQFGEKIIISWDADRNGSGTPVGKDGKYYLSTVETDGTMKFDESFTGTIKSPLFKIMGPTVSLKIAGGSNPANYVAVCRASDDTEIAKISRPSAGAADAGSHIFKDATIELGENYVEDEAVYIKIVDGTKSNWGFICVDDIRVSGIRYFEMQEFHWSFEEGNLSPFTITKGTLGRPVGNRTTEINAPNRSINKDGTYYFTTVEMGDGNSYDDNQVAELRSPTFYILDPVINFRMAGGINPNLYVALCTSDGKEIKKVQSPKQEYILNQTSMDVTGLVEMGTPVYLKLVDNLKGGWAFIAVDDIRFKGAIEEDPVVDIAFDFEEGTLSPLRLVQGGFGKTVGSRESEISPPNNPINKQGTYYFTSNETESGYSDELTGKLRSPIFTVDAANSPNVSFKIGGGNSPNGLYVALCKADGTVLKKATGSNRYIFGDVKWDLTGLVTKYDRLYVEVVDSVTGGWGNIIFDDFKAKGTYPSEVGIGSEEELKELTGWDTDRFEKLRLAVQDLTDTYPDEYTEGSAYLTEIDAKQSEHDSFWEEGVKASDPAIAAFKESMDALSKEAMVANPLISQAPMTFVTRKQYAGDHHNTHNMFPNYAGEYNDGSFTGGGALKMIDFANGGTAVTLKENPTGVFRDPDVSYDGNKVLVSYRKDVKDSYNIYEYVLSDDKTQIVEEKQLTSMSTADDMDPMYMPSGNIVFSATRDPKYVMCNRHIAANLYRMEDDGANIVKITNSTLFERPTDVLPDGRILYDRWEYNDRDFGSAQGLWVVAEDGTQQVTYYGNNSPTGAAIDAKAIPGTQNVITTLSSTHDRPWGGLGIIDRTKGVDGKPPVLKTWPENAINGIGGPGQGQNIDAYTGLQYKYEDPQPLSDKYFLASRQIPGKGEKMGIYLLDMFGNEILLYEDESGLGAFDVNILKPRDKEITPSDRRNYKDEPGSFFVQNVYEGTHMKGVEAGTIKTLRVVESMPKRFITRNNQWGGEGQQNPGVNWHSFEVKRTIGEVPVYEDGSAYFEVPQDKFVYFQLLDEDGRMVQSMRSGTLIQSGEKTGCIGCHDDRRKSVPTNTSRKTPIALQQNFEVVPNPDYIQDTDMPKTIGVNKPDKPMLKLGSLTSEPVAYDSVDYEELPSMNFLTEVQPIFTKNCLECHGYDNPKANLTLVPDKGIIFNAAYVDLWRNRSKPGVRFGNLLGAIGGGGTEFAPAKSWGSYASPLIKKIFEDPAHATRFTPEEKAKIAEWVDLNATYYGDYASNYSQGASGRSPLSNWELSQIPGLSWGQSWGETRPMPIYFDNPEKSPLLKNLSGDQRQTALTWIQVGHDRLKAKPDIDWRGLTAMPGNPSVSIPLYTPEPQDAWRIQRSMLRDAIEAANRKAIVDGKKRYDSDNAADGLLEFPAEPFPGFDK